MLFENIFSLSSAEILLVAVLHLHWRDGKNMPIIDQDIAGVLSNFCSLGKRSSYELANQIILNSKHVYEAL